MRRLFILRPQPGAQRSLERARELGVDAIAMPLFALEPVAWNPPEPARFDALLLTSANAVRQAGDALASLRALPVHAVGEATEAAAREAGFDIASTGSAGVERLLGSLEADLKLLHLCGEDRTRTQARQSITPLVVYRAAPLPAPPALAGLGGQVAVVHSPRAARRLGEVIEEKGLDRTSIRLAAISAAAAQAAGTGWDRCEAAEAPDDTALLALAARLCDKPDRQ